MFIATWMKYDEIIYNCWKCDVEFFRGWGWIFCAKVTIVFVGSVSVVFFFNDFVPVCMLRPVLIFIRPWVCLFGHMICIPQLLCGFIRRILFRSFRGGAVCECYDVMIFVDPFCHVFLSIKSPFW